MVNLHYILSKSAVKARPSVLWCYKKELELSSHKKKRMKQIKKQVQRGLLDPNKDNPFEIFMSSTQVRMPVTTDVSGTDSCQVLNYSAAADPILLLPGDTQDPGQHIRHVCYSGLRNDHT